jgi:hypothetical protein
MSTAIFVQAVSRIERAQAGTGRVCDESVRMQNLQQTTDAAIVV